MWCINCGSKLPDDAKFCMQCGTKVEVVKENINEQKELIRKFTGILRKIAENEKEPVPNKVIWDSYKTDSAVSLSYGLNTKSPSNTGYNQSENIVFSLFGKNIVFTKKDLARKHKEAAYRHVEPYFREIAAKSASKFINEYYRKYNGLDEFSERGLQDGWLVILGALTNAVEKFSFNININSFVETYGTNFCLYWLDAFDNVNDKYIEIVLKAQALDTYRKQRRQNRGRLVGGGFGLTGAAKGILTAGAINLAMGAAHGAFNMIGKGVSTAADASKKTDIYMSSKTIEVLKKGIEVSIYNIYFDICNVLNLSFEEKEEAKVLFENVKSNQELFNENLVGILKLDPYLEDAYKHCVETYGDSKNDVQNMAGYFGVDIMPYKTELLYKMIYDIVSANNSPESITKSHQAKLKLGLETLDISYIIKTAEKSDRTVAGVIYPTKEEAALAKKELEDVKELEKNTDLSNLESVQSVIENVKNKNFKTNFGKKFIHHLKQCYDSLDKDARTFNGAEYETVEIANLVKKELNELNEILNSADITSDENIEDIFQKIKAKNFQTKAANEFDIKSKITEKRMFYDLLAKIETNEYLKHQASDFAEELTKQLLTIKNENEPCSILSDLNKNMLKTFISKYKKQYNVALPKKEILVHYASSINGKFGYGLALEGFYIDDENLKGYYEYASMYDKPDYRSSGCIAIYVTSKGFLAKNNVHFIYFDDKKVSDTIYKFISYMYDLYKKSV